MFIFSRSAHSGLAIFSIGSRASSYRMRIPALRLLLLYILKNSTVVAVARQRRKKHKKSRVGLVHEMF